MTTTPIYNLTDTWNDASASFTAIGMDVTDTASGGGSFLLDLKVGGVSKFSVDKDGFVKRYGPLDLFPAITRFSKFEHYWGGTLWCDTADDNKFWTAIARTYKHTAQEGAVLELSYSDDGMNSWRVSRSLSLDKDTEPRFQVGGNMYNGRQGIMYACVDNASAVQGYEFVYSDDDWATYSRVTIANFGGNGIQFYGKMLPYPASVGGSDTGGYIIYGYSGDPANIVYVYTTDNGLNWTFGTAINNATGDFSGAGNGLTEPSVAIMTSGSRYIMACRNRDADGLTAASYPVVVSTSTNMTTWTTPVEIGELPLGSNPVIIMCEGGYTGRVHIYACARQDSIDGYKNAMMHAWHDASDFFDAAGDVAFQPYRLARRFANEFTGYIAWDTDSDGLYYGLAQGAESIQGAENSSMGEIYAFTPYPQACFNSFAGELLEVNENLFDNPTFNSWTAGTSFGPNTSLDTADRWKYSGAVNGTVSRQDVDADLRKHVPGNPLYAMRVQVAGGGGTQQIIRQEWAGREQLARFAGQNITVQMWFTNTTPDTYSVTGGLNFGTGGSPTAEKTNSSQMTKFEASGDGLRYCEATISMPPLEGDTEGTAPTFGSNADEYAFIYVSCGSSAFTVDILAMKAEFSDVATHINRPNPALEPFLNNPLTAAELQQLQNIGTVNLSSANWTALETYADNSLTSTELGQLQNIDSVTLSNANWTSLETYADNALDATELAELQNIGTTTISETQWGYLGGMNQSVATTDSVTFNQLLHGSGGNIGTDTAVLQLRVGGSNNYAADSSFLYCNQGIKLGHYAGSGTVYVNGTKVIGAQGSAIASLTDSTGGSTDGTLAAISGSGADSDINNNFAELNSKVDAILSALRTHGLIAT